MIGWLKKKLIDWCMHGNTPAREVHVIQTTRPIEKLVWAYSYDVNTRLPQEEINRQAAKELAEKIMENEWYDLTIEHIDKDMVMNYYTIYVARKEK